MCTICHIVPVEIRLKLAAYECLLPYFLKLRHVYLSLSQRIVSNKAVHNYTLLQA